MLLYAYVSYDVISLVVNMCKNVEFACVTPESNINVIIR